MAIGQQSRFLCEWSRVVLHFVCAGHAYEFDFDRSEFSFAWPSLAHSLSRRRASVCRCCSTEIVRRVNYKHISIAGNAVATTDESTVKQMLDIIWLRRMLKSKKTTTSEARQSERYESIKQIVRRCRCLCFLFDSTRGILLLLLSTLFAFVIFRSVLVWFSLGRTLSVRLQPKLCVLNSFFAPLYLTVFLFSLDLIRKVSENIFTRSQTDTRNHSRSARRWSTNSLSMCTSDGPWFVVSVWWPTSRPIISSSVRLYSTLWSFPPAT